jgi:hypothetical protein
MGLAGQSTVLLIHCEAGAAKIANESYWSFGDIQPKKRDEGADVSLQFVLYKGSRKG